MSNTTANKDELITKILGQIGQIRQLHADINDLHTKITDINQRIETAEGWHDMQLINFEISQL